MKAPDHKTIKGYRHIKYDFPDVEIDESLIDSKAFYHEMDGRRSVREFSERPVKKEVIQNVIKTASTAPSGAHKQPWVFCAVSNFSLKKQIRKAAEAEEKENYTSRMSERWKKDLEALATDANKAFLEKAPWLIVVMKKAYDVNENGEKENNYYVNESVGIACGMLITAIHKAGLVTLTHTPSPMNFLTKVLHRPSNERPYLLLPVGYPEKPVYVPDIHRKDLEDISVFYT